VIEIHVSHDTNRTLFDGVPDRVETAELAGFVESDVEIPFSTCKEPTALGFFDSSRFR
jgi:hypothetical protein